MKRIVHFARTLLAATALAWGAAAQAEINVGVIVSLTGPGATDPTTAAKNLTKLITEDRVDADRDNLHQRRARPHVVKVEGRA